MKYFVILNEHNKLIAYNEEKRIVYRYLERYNLEYERKNHYATEKYRMVKMKSKDLKSIVNYEDYYLIRSGTTFIQAGFYQYIEEDVRKSLSELYLTNDVLKKLLEFDEDLESKDKKAICKTIKYISEKIADEEDAIYPLRELEVLKEHYESFRDNLAYLENDDWRWTQ